MSWDKRLMEASKLMLEAQFGQEDEAYGNFLMGHTILRGETGSCSDGQDHVQ